jgi:hypothetical protein
LCIFFAIVLIILCCNYLLYPFLLLDCVLLQAKSHIIVTFEFPGLSTLTDI